MGTYCFIKSKLDGHVIDIQGASTKSGVQLDAFPQKATGNDNQLWEFVPGPDGYYFIKSKLSGNVIDIAGASAKSGAPLDAWPQKATGNDNQLWEFVPGPAGYCFIKSKLSGNVIDIEGASAKSGAPLDAFPQKATANDNQLWMAVGGAFPPPRPVKTATYQFGIGDVKVVTQRSPDRESDTDYLTLTVASGSRPPIKGTRALGDHNYGDVFNAILNVNAEVADDERVVMSYVMLNHGNSESSADILSKLESVGETLAKAAIAVEATAASIAAGAALNVIMPGFGTLIIPILDSALIAIGDWLVNELSNVLSLLMPNCDGPVAAGVHVFTGAQLRNGNVPGQPFSTVGTDNCVGINSPSGCGDNSLYDVKWFIDIAP